MIKNKLFVAVIYCSNRAKPSFAIYHYNHQLLACHYPKELWVISVSGE